MNVRYRNCLLVGFGLLSACNLFTETATPMSDVGSRPDMALVDGGSSDATSTASDDVAFDTAPADMDPIVEKDVGSRDVGPDQPVCVPESDVELCERLGATCDSISASDNCGATRTVNCGACADGEQCQANQCRCVPESDAQFCARNNSDCDATNATDNCQITRDVDCGTCNAPDTCQINQCGCIPEDDTAFCDRLTIDCGTRTDMDNCGADRTIDCGGCSAPAICGGGGTPNVCACASQSDADFCAMNGATCGPLTAQDDCGLMRTVDCGACMAPETCTGSGVANECGCSPESDATLCSAAAAACGSITATDSCGGARTADCGGCGGGICDAASNQCLLRFESFPNVMVKSGGTQPSDVLSVSGCTSVALITIDIDITHTYRGDLRVELQSPEGTLLLLKSEGTGGAADDLIGNYPLTLVPVDALDTVVGEAGDGDWVMNVSDQFNQDNGTWNSWAINLSCN